MRLYYVLIVVLTLFACKADKPEEGTITEEGTIMEEGTITEERAITDENTVINVNKTENPEEVVVRRVQTISYDPALPEACDLISKEFLAAQLGTGAEQISLKKASNSSTGNVKSCFYRWPDDFPNTGMFIQVQTNPFPEEAPEFHKLFIEARKNQGEQMIDADRPVLYDDWEGIGDDAAYSYELQKYVWRVGNDFSYLLAFNTDIAEARQKQIAKNVALEILKNHSVQK